MSAADRFRLRPAGHCYRDDALVREHDTLTATGGVVIAAADILAPR